MVDPPPLRPFSLGRAPAVTILALILLSFVVVGVRMSLPPSDERRNKDDPPKAASGHDAPTGRTPDADARIADAMRGIDAALALLRSENAEQRRSGPAAVPYMENSSVTDGQRGEIAAALRKCLTDPDGQVRLAAALRVRHWPRNLPQMTAAEAEPVFKVLLSDPSPTVRIPAAAALAEAGNAEAVALLTKVAADATADPTSRRLAFAVGIPAMVGIREAVALNTAEPVAIRVAAIDAMANAHAGLPPAVGKVIDDALTNPTADPQLRIRAFRRHPVTSAPAFGRVVKILASGDLKADPLDDPFRLELARVLAYGIENRSDLPPDWVEAAGVAEMAKAFTGAHTSMYWSTEKRDWDALTSRLCGTQYTDRLFRDALVKVGPKAIPALRVGLASPFTRVRNLQALAKLGDEAKVAIPDAIAVLKDKTPADWPVAYRFYHPAYQAAAQFLAAFGPATKPALPALLDRIKADFAGDVSPFVTAVGAIGPDAVAEAGELLKHVEPKVRIAAAFALALIGPECRSKATPLLRRAIEIEKNDEVKRAFLDALGAINPVEAEKLGWQRRVEMEQEAPRLVAHAGGRLELVRPTPPPATHYYTPQPRTFMPVPIGMPQLGVGSRPNEPHLFGRPRTPIRPFTPVYRPPVRIR